MSAYKSPLRGVDLLGRRAAPERRDVEEQSQHVVQISPLRSQQLLMNSDAFYFDSVGRLKNTSAPRLLLILSVLVLLSAFNERD